MNMKIRGRNRRVFVSAPRDIRLGDQNVIQIKHAIIDRISRTYKPERFLDPSVEPGLASERGGWNLDEVERVARRCIGAVLIGVPFWKIEDTERWLPTDYCQSEGAIAHALGLPILSIAIGIEPRILFDDHSSAQVITLPDMKPSSLETDNFSVPFENWERQLAMRRDVFLGYCSSSKESAAILRRYLEKELGATVLDWERDFKTARTIMAEVEEAASRCSLGVFLFTRDDSSLADDGQLDKHAPRDNVVLEAGYFKAAKGHDRVLVIRESGAKIPADLGGEIYLELSSKLDFDPIKVGIQKFMESI